MLKKIALVLLLIAPMSLFAQKFAHFRSMDIIPVMPEYAKAQTDIQALQKQYEDEIKRSEQLQKAYTDMMDPIYKKLEDAVKAIGAAGGYTYVFDLNRTDIPYIDENVSKDVTNDIKTKLGISLTAVPATPAAPAATAPAN